MDDDVFLNVAKINKIEAWNNHDSISGFVNADVIPIRQAVLNDPLELYKWICPKWMFSGETYPNYTAGPAYIIPKEYINCLYQMAMKSSSKLYIEDIFITGILRDKCNIELKFVLQILNDEFPSQKIFSDFSCTFLNLNIFFQF